MFVASIKSSRRIIHNENCYHLNHVSEGNLTEFSKLKQALGQGFHPCGDCMKGEKRFDGNYKRIYRQAADNNINWEVTSQHVAISTPLSCWKIVRENDSFRLFHSNVNGLSRPNSEMPGYHDQKVSFATIEEYFRYIASHDEYRKLNPVKPTKKKGTGGYKKQQECIDKKRRHKKVVNVYRIIDSLASGTFQPRSVASFSCVQ